MLKRLTASAALCAAAIAQASQPCIQFSVITQDTLKNVQRGLSADDQKWFREKVEKKNPSVCYADPSSGAPIVFVITVTPDTYHGTRVITNTSTNDNPTSGTITDDSGNTATYSGTQQTTSTSSTAVPYSFEYGIYTLSVEQRQKNGSFVALHRFQQKGIYRTMYGIPLGGKGHHPAHAVIQEAAEWINAGGLAQASRFEAESVPAKSLPTPIPVPSTIPANSNAPTMDHPGSVTSVLDISSNPSSAEIEIDGGFVGDTPSSIEVSFGEHVLKIAKKGFLPWERTIRAMPGHATISPELQPDRAPEPQ
jgi:hypothetical protein